MRALARAAARPSGASSRARSTPARGDQRRLRARAARDGEPGARCAASARGTSSLRRRQAGRHGPARPAAGVAAVLRGVVSCAAERSGTGWPLVRALVRAGAIERPEAGRTTSTACSRPSRAHGDRRSGVLREDPALLGDEVWELFALDGGARDSPHGRGRRRRAAGRDALTAALPRATPARRHAARRSIGDLERLPRVVVHEALARAAGDATTSAPRARTPCAALLGAAAAPVVGVRGRGARPRRAVPPATWTSARRWPPRRRRPSAPR